MNRTVRDGLLRLEGGSGVLEIWTELTGRTAVMRLSGSVTSELETELTDEILAFVSVGRDVLLDFSGLDYLAPTAQKALMDIQLRYVDRAGTRMEICGVSPGIYAQLQSSRLDTQLSIMRKE